LGCAAWLQEERLDSALLIPLSSLIQLRSLGLPGSDAAIPELTPWQQLRHSLTRLDLHGSYVSDIRPLLCLTGLQQLDLGHARQLKDLGEISKLVSLTELNLKGCAGLTDLQPVQLLTTLRRLQQP
jgi:Leucine-rich repeat (LRR) protein